MGELAYFGVGACVGVLLGIVTMALIHSGRSSDRLLDLARSRRDLREMLRLHCELISRSGTTEMIEASTSILGLFVDAENGGNGDG